MRKKSKASSVHPKKLAATTCFCALVQPESAAMAMVVLLLAVRTPISRRQGCRASGLCSGVLALAARFISLQMRIGDSQQRAILGRLCRAAAQQIADNVIGLDRPAALDIPKH